MPEYTFQAIETLDKYTSEQTEDRVRKFAPKEGFVSYSIYPNNNTFYGPANLLNLTYNLADGENPNVFAGSKLGKFMVIEVLPYGAPEGNL